MTKLVFRTVLSLFAWCASSYASISFDFTSDCTPSSNTLIAAEGPGSISVSGPVALEVQILADATGCTASWTVNSPVHLTEGIYFLGNTMDFLFQLTLTSSQPSASASLEWSIYSFLEAAGPGLTHSNSVLVPSPGSVSGSVFETYDSSSLPVSWFLPEGDYTFTQVVTLTLQSNGTVDLDSFSASLNFPAISQLSEAPEPSSWLMVSAGCLFLGWKRHRRTC